jgi:ketosteroid isomerase-like protein
MYKILLSFVLAGWFLLGCNQNKKEDEAAMQQLLQLNNEYDSAILRNDTAILKRIYAEDYVFTNPEGRILTRAEQLSSIAVSEVKWATGRSEDVKVKIYDDMAVMTGAFLANGSYRGNPLTIHERYTAVWIKTENGWQLVAEQGNVLK